MDLRQLRYLDMIIEHKTMSRAANALYISQPALTISINNLEEELGFKVIQRGEDGYILTESGKRFYRHAKLVLSSFTNLEEDIQFIRDSGSGRLKIGITEEFRAVIPELFELFMKHNPQYDIKLLEGTTGEMINKLRLHEIHFCLAPLSYLDEDMESILLSHNKYSLLVRKEDVEKYREKESLSVPDDFNFIAVEDYYNFTEFIKSNNVNYKNLLQVSSIGAAVRLVKKGLGISVIPELYARNYTDPEVKSVKLKYDLYGPDLYLNYMKRQNLPPAIEDFIKEIKDYVASINT